MYCSIVMNECILGQALKPAAPQRAHQMGADMRVITNALALVGALALAAGLAAFIKARALLAELDPGAGKTWSAAARIFLETGNPAEAAV